MFVYEKKLQYPVKIATPNPKLAAFVISQYGGLYTVRLQSYLRQKTIKTDSLEYIRTMCYTKKQLSHINHK